jgi:hypothetical protein
MDDQILERIRIYSDKELPCAVAHYIAAELQVSPLKVGQAADAIGVRITQCQVGMFGYARKGHPHYRIREAMADVPPAVAAAIREATSEGRAPCAELWRIAGEQDMSRLEIGDAIEGLGIQVKPCQLGCF